jgi:Tol biopolymer transport system component
MSVRSAKLALMALTCLIASRAYAGDPNRRWRTLETEHFRIHFYQGEEKVARALAVRAERAHRILSPLLAHEPSRPTHIVLTDDVDSANGSASVLPYNLIRLFASGPESESVLNDFDDWMNLLITHEYTHILHIDNISGVPVLANWLVGLGVGKVFAPNQIQPRWFIEGLATYEESAHTTAGRTRSKIFEGYLRTQMLSDEWQSIDMVTSGTLAYPHGSTAYLYGSFFLKYIGDRFGDEALAKVSKIYGGRAIPFGLNRAIAEATGHDYDQLWGEFSTALRHRYEVQKSEIEARGRTHEWALTTHHEGTVYPHPWAVGDDIMYVRNDGYDRIAVMRVPPRGGAQPRLEYKFQVGGEAVPLPDGRHLLTSEVEVCKTVYYYNDLYLIDVPTGQRRPLTECGRAMDPDVSPNGRFVAYQLNEAGGMGSSLGILALDDPPDGPLPTPRRLVEGSDKLRVYTPSWSPDGKTIAYSEWAEGGWRDIVLVDVATGARRRLQHDRALDITPRFSPDGKYVLFSSDRTGIYNVFAFELATGKLFQVTNVLGGAFEAIVANDNRTLVYQAIGARGYDIYATDYDPKTWKEALPFVSERDDFPLQEVENSDVVLRERPYSAWETAHPWRISGASIVPGSFEQLGTLDLSGSDATGIHSWTLHLEQGLGGRGETNESVAYTWDRLWTPLSLNFSHRTVRSGGLIVDLQSKPYAEEQWSAQAFATLPIVSHVDHNVSIDVGYHYLHFGAADAINLPLDPNMSVPTIPEHGALSGVSAGLTFSNVRRWGFSVTPEEGRIIALNLSGDFEAMGADFHTLSANWGWTEFLKMPIKRNVLQLSYGGGIGSGNLSRRGLFFLGGFGDNPTLSSVVLCAVTVPVRRTLSQIGPQCPGGTPPLRGYAPGSVYGDQFHVASAEWRFPIAELERGVSTLPVYTNRIVGAAYADYGNAYFGSTDLSDFRVGVGGELGINLTIGYTEGASLRVGYARGLMKDGQDQVYFQFQLGQLY